MPVIADVADGLDRFLSSTDDHLKNELLQQELPLLGSGLGGAEDPSFAFLDDLRQAVADAIATLTPGDGSDAAELQDAEDLITALNAIEPTGAVVAEAVDGGNGVRIRLIGSGDFALGPSAGARDLTLPGLRLEYADDPQITSSVDYAYGFVFDYDIAAQTFAFVDEGGAELTLSVVGDADLSGEAALGELGLDAIDASDNELTVDVSSDWTDFNLVDPGALLPPSVVEDNRQTTISGAVTAALDLDTTSPSVFIPEFTTAMALNWSFDGAQLGDTLDAFGDEPAITFDDIRLEIGPFADFLDETFGRITGVVTPFPVDKIVDILTRRIPVLDDIGRGFLDLAPPEGVTLIDVVQPYLGEDTDFIFVAALNTIAKIDGAIEAIREFSEPFTLGDVALTLDARSPDPDLGAPFDLTVDGAFRQRLDALYAELSALINEQTQNGGFEFPFFEDPTQALDILFNAYSDGGDAITILAYDVPRLDFNVPFDQFFPAVGPIGVVLTGNVGAAIDFTVAAQLPSSGFDDLSIEDVIALGADPAEPVASVFAGLGAGAGVNAYVLRVDVLGGVLGSVDATINDVDGNGDPDDDGFSPIGPLIESGCIFEPISGELAAQLGFRISIGLGPFSFTRYFDLFETVLANFEVGCEGQAGNPQGNNGVATLHDVEQDGATARQMRLSAGPDYADDRIVGDVRGVDGDESFIIRPFETDEDGDGEPEPATPSPGPVPYPTLTVLAFGLEETFGSLDEPIETIFGRLGDGNDSVYLDERLTQDADIEGGAGFDQIYGAQGNDILRGGSEDDFLTGREGDDELYGDAGFDTLSGGPGADLLDGGADRDQVSYEDSPEGVVFSVGERNGAVAFFGAGGYAQGDIVVDVEDFIGSLYRDVLRGNPSEGNTLDGEAGDDVLIGGDMADFLLGGPGADRLIGGGNADGLDGAGYTYSYGGVQIDLRTGEARGGDAAGDELEGMEAVAGSGFDDTLTGTTGNNVLIGSFGDDVLRGVGGHDRVQGGQGDDTVYGDADGAGDLLDGGGDLVRNPDPNADIFRDAGVDLLSYRHVDVGPGDVGVSVDLYDDGIEKDEFLSLALDQVGSRDLIRIAHRVESGGTGGDLIFSRFENLEGSLGSDPLLSGDSGDNEIDGLTGDDNLFGREGDDILRGGAGADVNFGGVGVDTVDYSRSFGGVTVDIVEGGSGQRADAAGDGYFGIENIRGSSFNDFLFGNGVSNRIEPGLGVDVVEGRDGIDVLVVDYSDGDLPGAGGLGGGVASGASSSGFISRTIDDVVVDSVDFGEMERFQIIGTSTDDVVFGGAFGDLIVGGGGNDEIWGGIGVDLLLGGDGDDLIVANSGLNRTFETLETLPLDQSLPFFFDAFRFDQLNGGDGVDALMYNGQYAPFAFDILFGDGDVENPDQKIVLPNNTSIAEFERLAYFVTSVFPDLIGQSGRTDNIFFTSLSDDEIRPGLGFDIVDAGRDFFTPAAPGGSTPTELPPEITDPAGTEVDGDLLVLDYRDLDDGTPVLSLIALKLDDTVTPAPLTNDGVYARGADDLILFFNIERLQVDGGSGDDLLVGAFGLDGARGDDVLRGHGGVDFIFGAAGDDLLEGGADGDLLSGDVGDDELRGGAGDDFLFGVSLLNLAPFGGSGTGSIDILEGGDGADAFFLGLGGFVFYNDGFGGVSGEDRAILRDFDADEGDKIGLAGTASDYVAKLQRGSTFIYQQEPGGEELIAELEGVDKFDLTADYVVYSGDPADPDDIFGRADALILETAARQGDAPSGDLGAAAATLGRTADPSRAAEEAAAARGLLSVPSALAASNVAVAAPEDVVGAPGDGDWVDPLTDRALISSFFAPFGALALVENVQFSGDSRAFGVFDDDPLGLGSGIMISTGVAEDLVGRNENDGGRAPGREIELDFVNIGSVDDSTVYRARIDHAGLDIASIVIQDGFGLGGARGPRSGVDIDAVILSTELTTDPSKLDADSPDFILVPPDDGGDEPGFVLPDGAFAALDVFDFSPDSVFLSPGSQRLNATDDVPNGPDLDGMINGMLDAAYATLGASDFVDEDDNDAERGFVSLGNGGSIAFDLSQPLPAAFGQSYLYVVEAGQNENETLSARVLASNSPIGGDGDLSTDFGRPGAEDDTITLSFDIAKPELFPGSLAGKILEFEYAVLTEETAEFSGTLAQDTVKIFLNGVNVAALNDGAALDLNNLAPAQYGPFHPDYTPNPVATGPLSDETRADGFTQPITFRAVLPAESNTLTFELSDVRDGGLDTAIMIKQGSFRIFGPEDVTVEPLAGGDAIAVSEDGLTAELRVAIQSPTLFDLPLPPDEVTVTLRPDAQLDLGAGAGEPVEISLGLQAEGGPLFDDVVTVAAAADALVEGDHFGVIGVDVASDNDRYANIQLAPLLFEIADREQPALVGTTDDDRIVGGQFDDLAFGGDGDDVILGRRGDDDLRGEGGGDRILGGRGDDDIDGGVGANTLNGGAGDDSVRSGLGSRVIVLGASGDDRLTIDYALTDDAMPTALADLELDGWRIEANGGAGDDVLVGKTPSAAPLLLTPDAGPIGLREDWVAGAGDDAVRLERAFALGGASDGAPLEVSDRVRSILGAGDDTLEDRLILALDENAAAPSIAYFGDVTHRLGAGDDSAILGVDFTGRNGSPAAEVTEEVVIAYESISLGASGDDEVVYRDVITATTGRDAAAVETYEIELSRHFAGGAGSDVARDESRIVFDPGAAGDDADLLIHEATHAMQQGSDVAVDASQVEVTRYGESDLVFITRLLDGGSGDDALGVRGAVDFTVAPGDAAGATGKGAKGRDAGYETTLRGGRGEDTLVFAPEVFRFEDASGALDAKVTLDGGRGDDVIYVDTRAVLDGLAGTDAVAPEFRIDGGRGFDAVFFVSDEDVKIDLDLERASVGGVEFWIEDVEEISVVDRVEYDDLLA